MIQFIQKIKNGFSLPVVWNIAKGNGVNREAICSWLAGQRPLIDTLLNTQGALLIRGLSGLQTAEDFEAAISVISQRFKDYVGGTSPREKVHGNIMTATYTPPDWSIPLHQEMAYTSNPPDRIAFFCTQPAESGGDSTLGDMRAITQKIPAALWEKFQSRGGLQLRRTLLSEKTMSRKPGVKKPWNEIFGSNDPAEINVIAQQKGWRTKWLDADTLHLFQEILPAMKRHPVSQVEVWFNQAHFFSPACMMAWAKRDGRTADWLQLKEASENHPELLDAIFHGNGEPVSAEDALAISALLETSEIRVKMEKSDLLILDNTLVAHGRTAFSGQREILVALLMNEPVRFAATG